VEEDSHEVDEVVGFLVPHVEEDSAQIVEDAGFVVLHVEEIQMKL
jgi:hypothetical protein